MNLEVLGPDETGIHEVSRIVFRNRNQTRRGPLEECYVEFAGLGQAAGRPPVLVCFCSDSLEFWVAGTKNIWAGSTVEARRADLENWEELK